MTATMKVFLYTLVLIFVSQTTFGLLAHCSSSVQQETQSELSHHSMSQMTDMQMDQARDNTEHDCCDQANIESSFPDSCDCEAGLIFALVLEPYTPMNHITDSYLSIRSLPKLEPATSNLLRPPISI